MRSNNLLSLLFVLLLAVPGCGGSGGSVGGDADADTDADTDVDADADTDADADVDVDVDGDGSNDAKFSFGTGDLTEPSGTELCVPLDNFVYDLDGDGELDPVSGIAHIKVKALNPGKGNGRQNNEPSTVVETTLP